MYKIFEELIERWLEEFGRAVEMFTGEKPSLNSAGHDSDLSEAQISEHTWWKQVVQGDGAFAVWAGATEALWNVVGEDQSTFFEMLSQANQGTAAVLSAGFPVPLKCTEGAIEAPSPTANVSGTQIKITFRGAEAGTILLFVEKAAFAILDPPEPASPGSSKLSEANSGLVSAPPMLGRLMDLQLPVSVLLGRANITIKEALKLMSGSVIELDRQVGDLVEVIVHGTVVAKGEIVSVKGNYGVRIKEVISRRDRMALHDAA